VKIPNRKIGLMALLVTILASACGANVTSTPLPTLTPTSAATEAPKIPTYVIDNAHSIINYVATGPFNITFPGTFSLKGNTVRLVPEGNGYRIKLDGVIDGESVTAVNGLVRDAHRGFEGDLEAGGDADPIHGIGNAATAWPHAHG
jgi:hypothetical protein